MTDPPPGPLYRSCMPTHFSSEALRFLRGLARHNDRAWFEERRPLYEQALKAPLLTLIAEVNDASAEISPQPHLR